MSSIDFGRAATDYSRHRAGFPAEFFARVAPWGVGVPGQALLDVGTGTGTLARGFALRGCRVTGLDPSAELIAQARELDGQAGVDVKYVQGYAEKTGMAPRSFDVVTAGQSWHWFKRDLAAAEVRRLLRPNGVMVIAYFDWLPLPGSVVEATERLILAHNPGWALGGGCGVYGRWFVDLSSTGFLGLESFSVDVMQPYSHEAWRGRIRASAGVAASLDPGAVARFDDEHAALLAQQFPDQPLRVPHRVFALIGRKIGE